MPREALQVAEEGLRQRGPLLPEANGNHGGRDAVAELVANQRRQILVSRRNAPGPRDADCSGENTRPPGKKLGEETVDLIPRRSWRNGHSNTFCIAPNFEC